ncbi:MAG TPA: amino acid permease [Bryobacteraceae bacterium]|nr:amino acid permease [Bryobacteraceae bacterium]
MTAGKAGLLRQLGLFSATALVVSNMVGTGIFTGTGFLAGELGSPNLVFSIWVVGGIIAFLGAICYSELGINFPSSGGEYVYLTRAFGPAWGFMTGWASFFAGFSAPIATAALAFSEYLGHFFPALSQQNAPVIAGSGEWAIRLGGAQAVACGLVAAFTVLNILGVQKVARVQNILTGVKVLVLLAFIVLGFTIGSGSNSHFVTPAARTVTTSLAEQFALSLVFVFFAYSGWNAATYVAEELRQPARTLPLALGVGTALVTTLYLVLNFVFVYAAPLEELKGKEAVGAFAASRLFGPEIAGIFSGLMALSLMSTVNAMITVGPRVYYAMAGNGAFPAIAGKVHPRFHTPVAAIVAQGVCTMIMTLTPFRELIQYIGFTLYFFAAMSVASLFIFRRRPGWQKLRVVSFAYPLFPLLFILMGVWVTYQGIVLKPFVALAAGVTLATGALVYHLRLRSRAPENPGVETY